MVLERQYFFFTLTIPKGNTKQCLFFVWQKSEALLSTYKIWGIAAHSHLLCAVVSAYFTSKSKLKGWGGRKGELPLLIEENTIECADPCSIHLNSVLWWPSGKHDKLVSIDKENLFLWSLDSSTKSAKVRLGPSSTQLQSVSNALWATMWNVMLFFLSSAVSIQLHAPAFLKSWTQHWL